MELLYFCHGVSHIRRSGTDGQLSVSAVAGKRLKKRRRRGSGASVSGGVSGVTEEATIKISKSGGRGSGLGKNRHAEQQRWELFADGKKRNAGAMFKGKITAQERSVGVSVHVRVLSFAMRAWMCFHHGARAPARGR